MAESTWVVEATNLAKIYKFLRGPNEQDTEAPPKITKPIDTGAGILLAPYTMAASPFQILQVESLLDRLNTQLVSCLETRQRAQQLEASAFGEVFEMSMQQAVLAQVEAQASLIKTKQPEIIGNHKTLKLDGDKITGDQS